MKKYKLIKTYPGSPELGYITKFNSENEDYNTPNMLLLEDCSNFPEYWQEVVEKDYEILSFISTGKFISQYRNKISNLKKNGLYNWIENNEGICSLNSMLLSMKNGCNNIHSVKRLSDGEIFTIGDRVQNTNALKRNNPKLFIGSISNFKLLNNSIIATYDGTDNINHISKIKQPLFTTHDGVDIFEGDKFYWIPTLEDSEKSFTIFGPTIYSNKEFDIKYNVKNFKSKEKAEEYIIMNKPCLSIEDVAKIYVSARINPHGNSFPQAIKLREMVKQKLKL